MLCLKVASLRDEHLKFCTLAATNTRENRRWYRFLFTDFEKGADYFVPAIHTDIVVIANLSVFHNHPSFDINRSLSTIVLAYLQTPSE